LNRSAITCSAFSVMYVKWDIEYIVLSTYPFLGFCSFVGLTFIHMNMFWAARGQQMPPAGGIPTVPLTGNLNNFSIWCITYVLELIKLYK